MLRGDGRALFGMSRIVLVVRTRLIGGTFCILVSWKRPTGFSFFVLHFGLFFGVFDLASLVDNADAFGTKCLGASPKFVRGAYLRHTRHGSPCFVER